MVRALPHLNDIRRDSDRLGDRSGYIALDRNERVSPFGPEIHASLLAQLTPALFSAYPDLGPLYDRLGRVSGLGVEWLCTGAGSDSIIRRAFHAFLEPGDAVVTTQPTYAMYEIYAAMFRANYRTVPYEPDLTLDIDRLLRVIREGAKIVAIANPDQPSGTVLGLGEIERIAAAARDADALMLVDEAYFPFHSETALALVSSFENMLVVRSFSKAYGIAGLRVGFGAAHPNLIAPLQVVRGSGEVNAAGAAVATWLLDNPGVITDFVDNVERGRAVLLDCATRLGMSAPDCRANFQLLRLPEGLSAAAVGEGLKHAGYLVKFGFKHAGLKDCIRVTIDQPSVMEAFCHCLEAVVTAGGINAPSHE